MKLNIRPQHMLQILVKDVLLSFYTPFNNPKKNVFGPLNPI